uniref:VCBS repeat-containing protein n=1 Tax=candidate division WOR-3 bacterium TaxID=2052148 RepID=A0A7C4CAJ5_UNCW3
MTRAWLVFSLLLALAAAEERVRLLGRSPVEPVSAITAGCFLSTDTQSLLVVQELGRLSLSAPSRRGAAPLFRLALLAPVERRFRLVWASEPMLGRSRSILDLNPQSWTVADIDGDSLLELALVSGDSCRIIHFSHDSVTVESCYLPEARPLDVAVCDMDADSWPELVTLELSADSAGTTPAVRIWQFTRPLLQPKTPLIPLPAADSGMSLSLLGPAVLDDYPGTVVVVCAEHPTLRPSMYFAAFAAGPDSFTVTANPFPWQEWFRRDEVLPAGRLALFNVGDTLAAWGYFVPGSRPAGPDRSFAALQEGSWRLLRLAPAAERLAGQLCRFTHEGTPGWLELRDGFFRFYPGEVFIWR